MQGVCLATRGMICWRPPAEPAPPCQPGPSIASTVEVRPKIRARSLVQPLAQDAAPGVRVRELKPQISVTPPTSTTAETPGLSVRELRPTIKDIEEE